MADSASKSASEAEREVERARAQLVQSLDALHDRLSGTVEDWRGRLTPDSLRKEITTYVTDQRTHVVSSARDSVQTKILANPLPALMIGGGAAWSAYRIARSIPAPVVLMGAGVAWMMRSGNSGGADRYRNPYDENEPAGYVPGGVAGYGYPVEENAPSPGLAARVTEAATNLGDAALDASARAREAVRGATAQVGEAVREATAHASETASTLASRASASVSDVAERAKGAVGLSSNGDAAASVERRARVYGGTPATEEDTYPQRRIVRRSAPDIAAAEGWALGGLALAVGTVAAFALSARRSGTQRRARVVRVAPEPGTPHRPVPPLEVRERMARESLGAEPREYR